jgi:tRNA pseudouridine38-40 synthase
VEYDGTRYLGWQLQARGPTIQAAFEAALEALTGEAIRVIASGRTDAGVHARGQVVSFRTDSSIPAGRFAAALNAHLPPDIVVLSAEEADPDFHARYDARAKHYRYVILNRRARPALDRQRVYHVVARLDVDAMQRAADRLVGRHDFRSFASVDPLRAHRSAERELFVASVRRDGDRIRFDFVADGFLYNMARCIAGTLVKIGRGRWGEDAVPRILQARDRRQAGPNLPPRGLTLMRVYYRDFDQRDRDPDEKKL